MILRQPDLFLSFLVDAIDDDFVFYSLDASGRFVYLSKSARNVLGMNPGDWVGRPLRDALTNSECNKAFRHLEFSVSPAVVSIRGKCEFQAQMGSSLDLECRQVRILHNNQPIGFAGVVYQTNKAEREDDLTHLLTMVSSLSKVEREVIEFVYDGRQNKSIATELNVAIRTIESRRSRAMAKLQVKSLTQLVKLWARVRNLPNN